MLIPNPNRPITTSLFELFKAGPGPSSSHTIGPMLAGLDFAELLQALPQDLLSRAASLTVRLFGSLSATGLGHGTTQAVITGLLGHKPSNCPGNLPNEVFSLPDGERSIKLAGKSLVLDASSVIYANIEHHYPFNNTLLFELNDSDKVQLFSKTYYSVGGGFIQWDGWTPPERDKPLYPYATANQLQKHVKESGLSIAQIVLQNEMSMTGENAGNILHRLDEIMEIMRNAVARGIGTQGILPGTLNVWRKAAYLARKADTLDDHINRFLGLINAYAFAVSEENACGGIIVTAPTCGAAGVIPSILTILEGHLGMGPESIRNGLLAAAAVGFLAKNNAGIAGAEVGCQGEVGVASAMGAAMLAQARGYPARIVENAAEIALEHHLGLTCDPVGGYVQIPCIERNAMGALKAYNACLLASTEDVERHRVSLDMAIKAMAETGRDMNVKYKETAHGGLAVSVVEC